jgi:hypothetical protein
MSDVIADFSVAGLGSYLHLAWLVVAGGLEMTGMKLVLITDPTMWLSF